VLRWRRASTVDDRVREGLRTVGLEALSDRLPSELSHGHRKLVAMARALVADPRLVLLDEPAAGLDSEESGELKAMLDKLIGGGLTVLLIDHDMGLVLSVCDYIYVLNFGKIVAQGSPAEIRQNPTVIAAYLGEDTDELPQAGVAGDTQS
jgi:branched-chain amino acid transport system ATP-binding protein